MILRMKKNNFNLQISNSILDNKDDICVLLLYPDVKFITSDTFK